MRYPVEMNDKLPDDHTQSENWNFVSPFSRSAVFQNYLDNKRNQRHMHPIYWSRWEYYGCVSLMFALVGGSLLWLILRFI